MEKFVPKDTSHFKDKNRKSSVQFNIILYVLLYSQNIGSGHGRNNYTNTPNLFIHISSLRIPVIPTSHSTCMCAYRKAFFFKRIFCFILVRSTSFSGNSFFKFF